MKVKRLKHSKRVMAFYEQNFGFRKPYNILIDGTFCMAALKGKVDILLQVQKYLVGEVKIATTHCALRECFKLGPTVSGAHKILKKFARHKCGHENAALDAGECFKSMIGEKNPEHYILASQDVELRKECRKFTGIPLLFLSACTLFLESPSYQSRNKADYEYKHQDLLTEYEKQTINKLNNREEDQKVSRKRKRPKGPNPLSCKKKKSEQVKSKKKKKKKSNNSENADHDSENTKSENNSENKQTVVAVS